MVYGFKAAPVKLILVEIEVGLRFVAIAVTGSMVARKTPNGALRARPNMVEPNWEKEKVELSINSVAINDFMSCNFALK